MTPQDPQDDHALTLEAIDDGTGLVEHPETLTTHDHLLGLDMYKAVDDLDDDSNGLPLPEYGPVDAGSGYGLAVERARRIREVMLRFGVPEVSIEIQQGRPSGGDVYNSLNPVSHMSHHIASHPSPGNPTPGLALVKRGRSDLPGPLANGTAGVDLVYRILTLGWANHPGYGGPWTVSGPLGSFTIPRDNARPYSWGTEYEGGYTDAVWTQTYTNKRTGKSMTFREFMGRCNAALTYAIWLEGVSSRGNYSRITSGMDLSGYAGEHKTWAPSRKPDRRNISTEQGRAEQRPYYTNIEQEDDMSAEDVWNHKIPVYGGKEGETRAARVVLAQSHNRAENARRVSRQALSQANALRKIVNAIVAESGDEKAKAALAGLPDLPDADLDADETPDSDV